MLDAGIHTTFKIKGLYAAGKGKTQGFEQQQVPGAGMSVRCRKTAPEQARPVGIVGEVKRGLRLAAALVAGQEAGRMPAPLEFGV